MAVRSLAVVVALGLGLTGCGGSDEDGKETAVPEVKGTPPTVSRLAGTWSRIGSAGLLRFEPKGRFAIARTSLDKKYASGTYDVQGSRIRFRSSGPACVDSWTVTAGLVDKKDPLDDELQIALLDGGCDATAGTLWRLLRVSKG